MDNILYLAIGIAVGAAAGYFIGSAITKGKPDPYLQGQLDSERARADRAEETISSMQERERLETEQENRILAQMTPVQAKLTELQTKMEGLERERTSQYDTIVTQLRAQQDTDNQLRNTTNLLANALTNNQTRGGWGETRLEDIVKAAGLVKGIHYETQFETVNHNDEAIRPDMVIKLPESKWIAIDSKVPMIHFWRAIEEREKGVEASKEVIKQHMKKHIVAVKDHIKTLAQKDYWSGIDNSPEFTLMFIPSEPVLAATLDEENLMEYAFNNRVALVSPVSLFAVLKTVAFTWRQDSDEKAIHEIIQLGVDLYKEVKIIARKFRSLGVHVDNLVDDYNDLLINLDKSFLKPTSELNERSHMRFGTEALAAPIEVTRKRNRISNPELDSGETLG
jgi:DNA recombination protein RmuC